MAAIFLKITPKTLCVPLNKKPRLFRLKKNTTKIVYTTSLATDSARASGTSACARKKSS